ncbi:MAG TPA: hypothetical protein DEA55_06810 [Rhodospirillaceae bacterium]|nr:hypothetical protein [Rhodospirillaceae bacterium]
MKFYRFLGFVSVLCLCYSTAFSAHAVERLQFNKSLPDRAQRNIARYIEENSQKIPGISSESLKISATDLNRDGINEFIISTKDCSTDSKTCPYLVMADKKDSVILLGSIEARNIALADTYSHGIRDIHAYNNKSNDFDYDLFVWEPADSHYTIKDERR